MIKTNGDGARFITQNQKGFVGVESTPAKGACFKDGGMMIHYAWIIAFTGTLVLVLTTGFGKMSYSVILPSMREGLHLTYTQVGLIGSANFVGYLLLALVGGFVAIRFGSRRTIFVSLMVMGVSLFLTGLSGSFAQAFSMRFITGMGNGAAVVPTLALTASWFASRKRGLAAGIVTAGLGIGLSIGGLVIPLIVAKFGPNGWRYAWFFLGVSVFVLSFVCYALLRDNPAEKGTSMCGGTEEAKGQAGVTLFTAWKPIVREAEVWKIGVVYFFFGFAYIIYMTFIVAYLSQEIGLPPVSAGRIFATLGLCNIVSGALWGWISDRFGRRYGLMTAFCVLAASCIVAVFWQTTVGFSLSAILFGLTLTSVPSIMTATSGDIVGARLAPACLGSITILFGIGQALGPSVGGWMKDATGSFVGAFLLAALVLFLSAGWAMALKKGRVSEGESR